jgi:hypothetical protein
MGTLACVSPSSDALTQQVVASGAVESRLHYVVCVNPELAARRQAHRRHLLDHLEADLAAMGEAA